MFSFLRSCDPLAALICVYSTVRALGCIVHNLYCIPAYCLLNLLLLPLYYISVDTYSRVENVLYNWLLYVVSSWSWGAGLVVYEHGDDIYPLRKDPNVRLLMIANHQSTADVPLMMQALTARSKYNILWVMDAVFKWTNFGLVSQTHGDYFLNTKAYKPGRLLKHATGDYSRLKNLIVVFPEGGFRYKRQASSNSYAMKQNLPMLSNVTYPRFGAYSECIDPLVGVTHVVDLTICYDDAEHPPSIVDIVCGRRTSEVHFYYRVHSVAENPDVTTEAWLREQWQRKDAFLGQHYGEMAAVKYGKRYNSARTSLNGSLRSKASYSSMSPMSLSKEQVNMLSEEHGAVHNGATHQETALNVMQTPDTDTRASTPTTATDDGDLVAINTGNHPLQMNGHHLNGSGQLNGNGLKGGNRWASHESMDSNFPPSPATEELYSPTSQASYGAPTTPGGGASGAPFERTKGRPSVLSWTKLLLVHAFYLSVCLFIYEMHRF